MDLTGHVIVWSTVALLLYDVWVAVTKKERTISVAIQKYAGKFPAIPFGFGLLMGHWFL